MGKIQTAIDKVTVYRNGALVLRQGRAPAGEVSVLGMSLLYASETLKVSPARGAARDVRETCVLEHSGAPRSEDEQKVDALELEVALLADELRAIDALSSALSTTRPHPGPRSNAYGLPSASSWLELQRFLEDELASQSERRSEVEHRLEDVRRELAALKSRPSIDENPPRVTRGVTFALEAEGADEVEFTVEYFVPAARWYPTYAFELGGGDGAELSMSALVANATGEPWNDASLFFATTDLSRESTLPDVSSWRMGRRQAARPPAFRDLPEGLELLFAGYDDGRRNARRAPAGAAKKPGPSGGAKPLYDTVADRSPITDEDDGERGFGGNEPTTGVGMHLLDEIADEELGSGLFADAAPFEVEDDEAPEMARRRSVVPRMKEAKSMAPPPPMASRPSAPGAAPMLGAAAPMKKRGAVSMSSLAGGGAFEESAFDEPTQYDAPEPESLPPRFRYAYLRLRGPEAQGRGELHPLDPIAHLWDLVEDAEGKNPQVLRRAIAELERVGKNAFTAYRPAGVKDLADAYPWVFPSPGRHRIDADGRFHRVAVQKQRRETHVELRAVPRAKTDVYRFCIFPPDGSSPLPAGPMTVRENGRFVVATTLEGGGGGKPLELNLGVEARVRLERVTQTKQEEKGLVSQSSHVEHEVKLVATSSLPEHLPLIVYDRLPVAARDTKDIEVELLSSSPEAKRNDRGPDGEELRGGLFLKTLLSPGERREMSYRYRIVLPAKSEIVGGNRRE